VTLPGCHTRDRARRSSTESGPGPAQSGARLDLDPDGALHGLQPRDSLLSAAQRQALHQLRVLTGELDEDTARALHQVIASYEHSETRRTLPPGVAVRLQTG